jgi:ADP-ribose pyrophosphatase
MADQQWRLLKQRTIGEDTLLEVQQNDYELPNGSRAERYFLLKEQDAVHVVAVTPGQEILLVRQYRVGADSVLLEFPAGFMEPGDDDPLERARAELREETGYEAEEWHDLGYLDPAVHRIRKREYCFLALGARRVGEQDLDETETVRAELVALDRVRQLAAEGQITSATALAVLCKVMLWMERRSPR